MPVSLKLFLPTLAVVDDLGAILIMTFFYSANSHWAILIAVALALLLPSNPNLEEKLEPWVNLGILPLFALANAGVALSWDGLLGMLNHSVTWGIVLGLVLGKALGIVGLSLLGIRLRWATMPADMTMPQLWGLACLGGIGFTMSLFIASLAFRGEALETAKVAIFVSSLLSGLLGYSLLRQFLKKA